MKKILILLIFLVPFGFVACGGDDNGKEEPTTFTVTFNSNGGSAVESQIIDVGGMATKPTDPERDEYDFVYWRGPDGNEWNFNTVITGNITLTARWEEAGLYTFFTVTFDANGGSEVEPMRVIEGNTITNTPRTTRENHQFVHWYHENPNMAFPFSTTPIIEDITLTASWVPVSVVTFDPNGGEGGPEPMEFIYQDRIGTETDGGIQIGTIHDEGILVPIREGYIFRGYAATPNPGGTWIQYTDEWYFRARIVYDTDWWMMFLRSEVLGTYYWPFTGDIILYAIWEEGDEYYDPFE